jgi:hypothetical protein
VVTDPWLRKFIDLECFVLSGMGAKDTICAEMAFMFMERNSGKSSIDYPMGGSEAIISALIRGLEKHGGRVMLRWVAPLAGELPRSAQQQQSSAGCLFGRAGASQPAGAVAAGAEAPSTRAEPT